LQTVKFEDPGDSKFLNENKRKKESIEEESELMMDNNKNTNKFTKKYGEQD
jgi:hypothetical protein